MPITLTKRIRARRAIKIHDGMNLLLDFMRDVSRWIETVQDRVSRVYVLVADDGLIHLYVVQRDGKYDFELCRCLSEFTLAQFDIGVRSSGHIVPDGTDEELSAFFRPADAYVINVG
jgi:hypothetical protein